MLQLGTARKVTIYVNEDTQHHFASLCDSILSFLLHKGISGATATRAVAGFGGHRAMHTSKVEVLSEHLPIRIEFIDSAAKIDEIMPALCEMVNDGVIEIQDTNVVKVASKDLPSPPRETHREMRGPARLMRIYLGESDKWQGKPLYEAIVQRLRLKGVAGATVYRGILGYGVKGHTHQSGRLPFSRDLPVMISVVDAAEKLAEAIDEIEPMMQDGLIVLSDVEVIRLVRSQPQKEVAHANG
jgi:PII-like signaling protein